MGVAFFIVPEREVQGVDTFVDGKALGHARHLDKLAKDAGVKPLQQFFSTNPDDLAAMAESEGVTAEELPPEEWFTADEGLTSVRGMLQHLAANPNAIKDAPIIAADLQQFETVLEALKNAGVRWHLAIDF